MNPEWFPWYPHRFRRKTLHLSPAEDGAYRRLIDEYMITRQPLFNDDAALARIVGISKTEWECLAPRVRKFFRARNDRLIHDTCDEELRAQELRNSRASEKAKKAAFARYSKINGLRAPRMPQPATIQDKDKKPSSEQEAARESGPPIPVPIPATSVENQQSGRRWKEGTKPPHETSRAELEASFEKRRVAT